MSLKSLSSIVKQSPHVGSRVNPKLSLVRFLRCSAKLGETWQYNNEHYLVLAAIVEKVAGRPFVHFVQEEILNPVGMHSATYNATEAVQSGNRVDGVLSYDVDWAARKRWEGGPIPEGSLGKKASFGWWVDGDGLAIAGAGGLIMSGEDMVSSQESWHSFGILVTQRPC